MRRLIILTILISLATVGYSWEETPQQKIPPVTRQTINSDNTKNKPTQPQSITVTVPSSLNLQVSGNLDVNRTENQKHTDTPPTKWTDPISISTMLLVIVTVGLVLLARYQLKTTQTTTRSKKIVRK